MAAIKKQRWSVGWEGGGAGVGGDCDRREFAGSADADLPVGYE